MNYKRAYFIGVGGIGMSAIARYFNAVGVEVIGYDKTETVLTKRLIKEGIKVRYHADLDFVSQLTDADLVVFTPAIPAEFPEFDILKKNDIRLYKRAEVLGMLSRSKICLGVAGTHGKTTTSCLLAHIMQVSSKKTSAFLGGISSNYDSNVIIESESDYVVLESDEFDRSFLQLNPFGTIVTSMDADHLDIYGTGDSLNQAFQEYVDLLDANGVLVHRSGLDLKFSGKKISYGIDCEADAIGSELTYHNGVFSFRFQYKSIDEVIELGIPGIHNAENAVASIVLALENGVTLEEVKLGCKTFKGVKRRFEYHLNSDNQVYIDDYAHHPTELKAFFDSLELLYPGQETTVVFQPHLFSRTKDFMDDFAEQLSRVDHLILMPIYPARELPIPGVTSEVLAGKINTNVQVMNHEEVIDFVKTNKHKLMATTGAGDIDKLIPRLKEILI
jgi:UDP-N-acetylmuramate--alanine ligase